MMLGYHVLLLLGFCCFHVTADGIDDEMNDLASDIGDSIRSISSKHNHKVDWMFIVDHGGFKQAELHLEYSKYFIHQLTRLLYISPSYSQAGVVTYGSSAATQIPLTVQTGNQCDFRSKVNSLTLSVGPQSDLNRGDSALEAALDQLLTKGRSDAHKVSVLITTAGWGTVGGNPYQNIQRAKGIGTLVVIVLVFDRPSSMFARVVLDFASDRSVSRGGAATVNNRYSFELEATRGNLRRLYRNIVLASQTMPYLPLQVPASFCTQTKCQAKEACVCDTSLYDTYHCERDTYDPTLTVGCPANMKLETEKGQLMTTIFWRKPEAVDLSTSALTPSITASPRRNNPKYKTDPSFYNATHMRLAAQIGNTTITQKFTDDSGNSVQCSFEILVEDKEPPVISSCPVSDIVVNTTGAPTAQVAWKSVTASDNSKRSIKVELYIDGFKKPVDMRTFSIGSSLIELEYTDESANTAKCNFTVIVNDLEPPVVDQCAGPNSTIYSSDKQTYVDWMIPTFTDNSGLAVSVSSQQSPGYWRIGLHTITYTAVDKFGNKAQCDFTFTVRGYPCPELEAPVNGAIVCDNSVPGAVCLTFCQNPYDFEQRVEKFACVGRGQWKPSRMSHCAVRQTVFKTLPKSFYFDGHCSDYNVSQEIKSEAVKRYAGLVEGGYFKEAWGRVISLQDFNDTRCGAEADITTTTPTPTTNPTTTRPTTTSPTTVTTQPTTEKSTTATPTTTTATTTVELTTTKPTTARIMPTRKSSIIVIGGVNAIVG